MTNYSDHPDAVRARRYREAKRGGPPRAPQGCGTTAAYLRHRRNEETPCEACRIAWREYQQERRRKGA